MAKLILAAALAAIAVAPAASAGQAPVDPLTARVDFSAAQRFAALWRKSAGKPTAAQIASDYLAGGNRAIAVFTPGRIGSAERLAGKIAGKPDVYRDAVERCLPWVEGTNAQLRASYLGLKGLFPDKPLPEIAVVIGADNSGGTAGEGMQVIGLEVICRLSPSRAAFEERMRQFFAHETVHTLQRIDSPKAVQHMLLTMALSEGVPDLVTTMITGFVPSPERDRWAREHEAQLWRDFAADMKIVQAGTGADGQMNASAQAASRRWFANAGAAPQGWPDELGYWVGMRIAEGYVASAADPRAALEALLRVEDPAAILKASGFGARLGH